MSAKRQRILELLADRLRAITIANGFRTDAGLALYWGPVGLGPDDPLVGIAIAPATTETNPQQGGKKIIALPVQFHALAQAEMPQVGTIENAWLNAEAVLADIKQAIELEDLTLGMLAVDLAAGEVTPLPRQEGSTSIGLIVEYRVVYTEHWGNPEK